MSNAIIISNGQYTVTGVVKNSEKNLTEEERKKKKNSLSSLHVIAYYKMPKTEGAEAKGDKKYEINNHQEEFFFLGIGVTNKEGVFSFSCKPPNKKKLNLFLIVKDGGQELPILENGKLIQDNVFKVMNATTATPPIELSVYLPDSDLRKQLKDDAAPGWEGGFNKENPDFAYPEPYCISLGTEDTTKYDYPNPALIYKDLIPVTNPKKRKVLKKIYPHPDFSSLGKRKDNLMNIDKLDRQQKVLWAEFSWKSKPCKEDDTKIYDKVPKVNGKKSTTKVEQNRCYKMFSPGISRLGYTNKGRVYSIICPQQGTHIPYLGTMNLEVTVTGNNGWADENTRELAGDIGVEAKVWFSQEAKGSFLLRPLVTAIEKDLLGEEYAFFPSTKAKAIRIRTFRPGYPDQSTFPLGKGLSTDFRIPDFTKHEDVSWTSGHLGVQIGSPIKTGCSKVDKFNQTVVDLLNVSAGNMLKENNVLTWNVWFTAPEKVEEQEWRDHADKWRESINVKHDSPGGPGTIPRHFDGTPLKSSTLALVGKLLSIIFYVIRLYVRKISLKVLKYGMILVAINYMLSTLLLIGMVAFVIYAFMFLA